MSESENTGAGGGRSATTAAAAGASGETSGLDATVRVSGADRSASDPASDPAVDATVRIATGIGAGVGAEGVSAAEALEAGISATRVATTPGPDAAAAADSVVGTQDELCGRTLQHYKVLERIGAGGMGSVYRAHDLSLDRTVALKVIRSEKVQATAQRERFIREARSQAKLSHPNVVPIYYIGEEDGLLFFAMELVEGEPLDALLARGERIEWPRALEILHDVADALRMAHERGIVHRDIKPSNLLLDPSGLVKVADFGLAKTVESAESATENVVDVALTQQGTVLGSPLYMSPEQGQGDPVDHRSDIYSLGATFFHLLVGRPPFDAKSPVGVIAKHMSAPVPRLCKELPKLPEGVGRLVERMLAKEPAERFGDYEELTTAVRAARPNAVAPAGFFARGMALGIDFILLLILSMVLGLYVFPVAALYFGLGWWRFGKTVGKWLFRLRVRTVENAPLALWRCGVRVVALSWGFWVIGGLSMINYLVFGVWGLGSTGEGTKDLSALAQVLALLAMLTAVVHTFGFVWAGFRRSKRAWHDLVSGTMVVYHLPSAGGGAGRRTGAFGLGPLSRTGSRD